jgi:hypothetical protein
VVGKVVRPIQVAFPLMITGLPSTAAEGDAELPERPPDEGVPREARAPSWTSRRGKTNMTSPRAQGWRRSARPRGAVGGKTEGSSGRARAGEGGAGTEPCEEEPEASPEEGGRSGAETDERPLCRVHAVFILCNLVVYVYKGGARSRPALG